MRLWDTLTEVLARLRKKPSFLRTECIVFQEPENKWKAY